MRGTVDTATRRRAEYSTDASNYRVVPEAVVYPQDADDVVAALDVLRELEVPVTARGAGRRSRELDRPGRRPGLHAPREPRARRRPGGAHGPHRAGRRHVDAPAGGGAARAAVRPGPVDAEPRDARRHDRQQRVRSARRRVRAHGRQRPRARRRRRPRAPLHGGPGRPDVRGGPRTGGARPREPRADPHGVRAVRAPGVGLLARAPAAGERVGPREGARRHRGHARDDPRGHGAPGAGAVKPTLVVLGYPDMPSAADDVPTFLGLSPSRSRASTRGSSTSCAAPRATRPCRRCPRRRLAHGRGRRRDPEEAMANAEAIVAASGSEATMILPAGPEATKMWQIRADGAGLAGRTPAGEQAWPGWEDSAVPPEKLGDYLRDLDALMARYGVDGLPYGHFGDGCVHLRIDIPLSRRRARCCARSCWRRPSSSPSTAARSRASTATAARARSCCRSCTAPRRSRSWSGSRRCSTRRT